ncbi:MAG: sensor histidine kinase [Thermoanaerobaculia bacterium]
MSRLGGGIPLQRAAWELASICRAAADETEVLHAGRIRYSAEGDLTGRWDADRLHQVLANLLSNAFLYGAPAEPVELTARGNGASVCVDVANRGPAIPEDALTLIFDPFRRGPTVTRRRGPARLVFLSRRVNEFPPRRQISRFRPSHADPTSGRRGRQAGNQIAL